MMTELVGGVVWRRVVVSTGPSRRPELGRAIGRDTRKTEISAWRKREIPGSWAARATMFSIPGSSVSFCDLGLFAWHSVLFLLSFVRLATACHNRVSLRVITVLGSVIMVWRTGRQRGIRSLQKT